MIAYPEIDPVAFAIPFTELKVHWYGITYLVAFAAAWLLGLQRAKQPDSGWSKDDVGDLIFYGGLGVVLGGRLGSVFFYNFDSFLEDWTMLFRIQQGGMSFHGGLLGVMLAMWLFARKQRRHWFSVMDFVAPLVPLGLGAGRIGNFINAELWGKPTDLPWAMIFPHTDGQPRHPSMLYEFLLEGVVLFIILWWFSRRPRPRMAVSGLFLLGYGLFRFAVEFVREPDRHIGYMAWDWFTRGQLLSLPMIIGGAVLLTLAYRARRA